MEWLIILSVGFACRLLWRAVSRCANCCSFFGLKHESSRTLYPWDGTGEDPNADLILCHRCAILHHEYWNDMWDEYNSGRL